MALYVLFPAFMRTSAAFASFHHFSSHRGFDSAVADWGLDATYSGGIDVGEDPVILLTPTFKHPIRASCVRL